MKTFFLGSLTLLAVLSVDATILSRYSFTSTGSTGVGANGSLTISDNGQIDFEINNLATYPLVDSDFTGGYVKGFWFYQPSDEFGAIIDRRSGGNSDFSVVGDVDSTSWSIQDRLPNSVKNKRGDRNRDDYLGVFKSGSPVNNTIGPEQSATFSFFTDIDTLSDFYPDDLPEGPDLILRWQSVGLDGEDSDKTIAFLMDFDDGGGVVPEPSEVAMVGIVGVVGILQLRRRYRKAKAIKVRSLTGKRGD